MKDSIYVTAMEIGSDNPDGITFDDLVKKIESKTGKPISKNARYGLVEWFVDAFTTDARIRASSHKPFETYHTMIPSLEINEIFMNLHFKIFSEQNLCCPAIPLNSI